VDGSESDSPRQYNSFSDIAGGMEAEEGGTRRVRAVGVPASRGSQIADVVKQREDGYVCDQIVSREPHGVVAWKAVLLAEYGLGQKRS
jgi:hypothetical protein